LAVFDWTWEDDVVPFVAAVRAGDVRRIANISAPMLKAMAVMAAIKPA
jgi:hypothetical protein